MSLPKSPVSRADVGWTVAGASGMFRLGRRLTRNVIAVLTYHRVRRDGQWMQGPRHPNTVATSEFEREVAYLSKRYRILTGTEFRACLTSGAAVPRHSVLITFDDGYEDNFAEAFPVLRRWGATAIFFVVSGFIGSASNRLWLDELDAALGQPPPEQLLNQLRDAAGLVGPGTTGLRAAMKQMPRGERLQLMKVLRSELGMIPTPSESPMTWDQLRLMAEAGMTIGSHTATHQILAAATRDEVRDELASSREEIQRQVRQPCWAFSYPNGTAADLTDADRRDVAAAGYECAFTQQFGFVGAASDAYALPRVSVPGAGRFPTFLSRLTGVYSVIDTARHGRDCR